jgi:hypothetical protein
MVPRLLPSLSAILIFMSASAHAACGVHNDFLVRSDALLAPVRPADCETVAQTPPDFTWPPQQVHSSYTLALKFPDGHVEKNTTTRNFVTWPQALPPGAYSWSVKANGEASSCRRRRPNSWCRVPMPWWRGRAARLDPAPGPMTQRAWSRR